MQNGRRKERLEFEDVEPFAGKYVQAVGVRSGAQEGTPQRVAIALGPEYGTVSPQLVKEAAREALRGQGHDLLLVLGFAFDALALETVEEFRPSEGGDFASVAGERRDGPAAGAVGADEPRPGDGQRAAEEDQGGQP